MSEPNPWTTPEAIAYFESERDYAVEVAKAIIDAWEVLSASPKGRAIIESGFTANEELAQLQLAADFIRDNEA